MFVRVPTLTVEMTKTIPWAELDFQKGWLTPTPGEWKNSKDYIQSLV